MKLLRMLEPTYWFCAHMHAMFAAIVPHDSQKTTKFLALGKVLPGKDFLQVIDVPTPSDEPLRLEYDPEWLVILLSTLHLESRDRGYHRLPSILDPSVRLDYRPSTEQIEKVLEIAGGRDGLVVQPSFFVRNVVAHGCQPPVHVLGAKQFPFTNPQQEQFLSFLQKFRPAAEIEVPPREYDVAAQPSSLELSEPAATYARLSAHDLKKILELREVDFSDCVEKIDLVQKAVDTHVGATISASMQSTADSTTS